MKNSMIVVGWLCMLSLHVNANVYGPDVDAGIAVWTDGSVIYWDDLLDANSPATIGAVATNPGVPSISADSIVWEAGSSSSTKNLYGYNLSTSEYLDFEFASVEKRRTPDICGSRMVWKDYSSGSADIAMMDLTNPGTVQLIGSGAASQINPDIDGDIVVWMDNGPGLWQIFMCDVSQTPFESTQVSPSAHEQWHPAVHDDLIVWREDPGLGNGTDIYIFDLSMPHEPAQVLCNDPGDQDYPAISEDLIVWQEKYEINNGNDVKYAVRAYDRQTGQTQTIVDDADTNVYPAVSHRTIVWQAAASGIGHMTLAEPTDITLTVPEPNEMVLAGSQAEIEWVVEGPIDQVKIEFSSDNGLSWEILEPNVPAAMPYLANVPYIDSDDCVIRVSNFDNTDISDTLAGTFTIFQCDETLTADITGDCFVNLDDVAAMAAQWLRCGNPYDGSWCQD